MKRRITLLLTLLVAVLSSSIAQTTSSELKNRQRQIQKKINNTKTLIKAARNTKQLTMAEIGIINNQIAYREELINNINYQLKRTKGEINSIQQEVQMLEGHLQKLRSDYGKMLRYAYKHRNTDYKLMYIFSASDFSQVYKRMKYLKAYADFRQKQAERIQSTQMKLLEKGETLKGALSQKETLISEKQLEKTNFLQDQQTQKQALQKIMGDEARLKAVLSQQEDKKKKLTAEIRKAIALELAEEERQRRAKEKREGTPSTREGFSETPEIKLASQSFQNNKGKLPWPVAKGEITGRFGKHQHDVVKTATVENNGIDISTSKASTVRAVFNGEVSSILVIPGAGKVVMVKHGSYRTVYANLQEVYVSKGDKISIKQELGRLLTDGNISEAHFEIWRVTSSGGMEKQNPEHWMYKK